MADNEKVKIKTPGKLLVLIGWILIVLTVLATIGMIQGVRQRDSSIEAFLNHPDILSLGGTIGFIIGSNILTLPALLFGIYAVLRKNPKGKPLVITSIILFFVIAVVQFLPSTRSATQSRFKPLVITLPQSEFQVAFPQPAKKRIATVGGIETVAYESVGTTANPYLRVEFMNNIDTASISNNFRAVLENYARLSGLNLPEITETQDHLGKVGTYSGTKIVGDITIRIYGKMVLGDNSAINCLISENLEVFPSEDSTIFLVGIKRK